MSYLTYITRIVASTAAKPLDLLSQAMPPAPTFTEKHIGDLSSHVCIVTGSNTGVGKEVARILYSKNATVYMAARSPDKTTAAMEDIRRAAPDSTGRLTYLKLDLADLPSVKAAALEFLGQEERLHILINNAGVMMPPANSKTVQGHDLEIGTNCLGHFLFTQLLTPTLMATVKGNLPGQVRVVWATSTVAELITPPTGLDLDNLDYKKEANVASAIKYGISKAGDFHLAIEYERRHKQDGILSCPVHPGNLNSELDRHINPILAKIRSFTTYPAVYGAYSELFAALSPDVTHERMCVPGTWVVPFGRFSTIRDDIKLGSLPKSEGGAGTAEKFWAWCEEQVKPYM